MWKKQAKAFDDIETEKLTNSLIDELDQEARQLGADGILPLNGFSQKIYGVKLSDALRNVCQPILDNSPDTLDTVEAVLSAGMLAWNFSVLAKFAPERFQENYDLILATAEKNGYRDWEQYMEFLMERKKKLFPQIDMMLSDCKISGESNEYRLAVAGKPCGDIDPARLKKLFPEAYAKLEKPSLLRKLTSRISTAWGLTSSSGAVSNNEPDKPSLTGDKVKPDIIPLPSVAPEVRQPAYFDFREIENDGAMSSYCGIFPSERNMTLIWGNRELLVNDLYCLNPACHCHEVIVEFVDTEENEEYDEIVYGVFSIDYRNRDWSIPDEYPAFPDDVPMPVLCALVENQIPDFYEKLEERHKKLRQLYQLRCSQLFGSGSIKNKSKKNRKKNKKMRKKR
jgi:hypothetical protein